MSNEYQGALRMYLPFSHKVNSTSIVRSTEDLHIKRMGQGGERASLWEQLDLEGGLKQELLGGAGIRYSGNGEACLGIFLPSSCPHCLLLWVVPSHSSSDPPTSKSLSQHDEIRRFLADLESS